MAGDSEKSSGLAPGITVAVLLGALTVYLIRGTEGVHLPLLAGGLAGLLIGFLSPERGWIAALVQTAVLLLGVLVSAAGKPVPDIEFYSLAGAVGLTFVGSFIGAFIKRAFDS